MAKIENTKVYPTVTPAMDDLLIATDVSNKNETVTFLVSDLIGGAGVLQGLQSVLDTGNTATQNINLTGNVTVIGTVAPTTITALGSTGTAGQILSSTATGLQWINSPSTSCCTWNDSLISGNIATTASIVDGVEMTFQNAGGGIVITSPAALQSSGINTFTGEVRINGTDLNFDTTGQINDGAGSTGTAGQWLTSTGTGLAWSSTMPPSSCCALQSTLNAGSTSLNQGMSFTGTSSITMTAGVSIGSAGDNVWSGTNTFNGVVEINECLEDSNGLCGTVGQVLTSTGAAVLWSNGGAIGTQDLQGVLDTGNTATGANASITISGTIDPGSITDGSGSTGAAGQVLSWNGASLSWINTATPGVSDIALTPALFNTTAINSGALIFNVAGGTSTLTLLKYNGGSDIGMVPAGGTASTFLRGDGTWATPGGGGGGVTSITSSSVVSSVGQAITVNAAATGAVTVNAFEYDGDTNIGYVPRGSSNDATKYLDGTGNWTVPAGGGLSENSCINNYKVWASKLIPNPVSSNTYNTFTTPLASTGYTPFRIIDPVSTSAPSIGPGWTVLQQFQGQLMGAGSLTGCGSADPKSTLCGMQSTFVASRAGIHIFELWKADICSASPIVPIKVAEGFIDYTTIGQPVCITWTQLPAGNPALSIGGRETFFITYNTNILVGSDVAFTLNITTQEILS
jgi:hypothetical protein